MLGGPLKNTFNNKFALQLFCMYIEGILLICCMYFAGTLKAFWRLEFVLFCLIAREACNQNFKMQAQTRTPTLISLWVDLWCRNPLKKAFKKDRGCWKQGGLPIGLRASRWKRAIPQGEGSISMFSVVSISLNCAALAEIALGNWFELTRSLYILDSCLDSCLARRFYQPRMSLVGVTTKPGFTRPRPRENKLCKSWCSGIQWGIANSIEHNDGLLIQLFLLLLSNCSMHPVTSTMKL